MTPPAPGSTVTELVASALASHADDPLLRTPDRTWSYADVDDLAARIAAVLREAGVARGDRVAVKIEKVPETVALYLAVLRVGGVYLPLNTAYTGGELAYFLGDARPRVTVCDPARVEEVEATGADTVALTLGAGGSGTLLERAAAADPAAGLADADVHADDPAAILYTSGTTGRSKGAVLTHGALTSNCQALNEAWRFTEDDVLIHALPLYHVHGLFVALNMTLTTGASLHLLGGFDADEIVRLMPESTVLMGVPTFYTRLLDHPDLDRDTAAAMRLFTSGSAPLTAATHDAWSARTGHAILERYGMTETNMITSNPYDGERRAGTVGMPLPGVEVRLTDRETGALLPAGEVGAIEVRGPNVFREYWDKPEKTASEFTADGWFTTGDVGVVDDDGYLAIVGRDKDLIISGGYNVYPKEIESLLDAHPDVVESAVVGLPHADLGEAPAAVVVLRDGAQVGESELLASLTDDVARFKRPRAVRFVPSLPRNVMSKVQKAELRQTYAEVFAPAGAAAGAATETKER